MSVMGSNDFNPGDAIGDFSRQGSIRKVLHSLVGTESLLGKSAKMLDRPKSKFTDTEPDEYIQCMKEYSIIAEYRYIPGVYVIPSANSELLWFGVIFIRSGLYRGGIFRFQLRIPEEFPKCSHPILRFETKIFHPSIDSETYELSMENVFPQWSKNVNHIWQVLDYARSIFYQIPTKSIANKLAAHLYERDREEYVRQAVFYVQQSQLDIYKSFETDDAHYLTFCEYDENIHGETLRALKSSKKSRKNSSIPGLSWVKKGSLKPCSVNSYF